MNKIFRQLGILVLLASTGLAADTGGNPLTTREWIATLQSPNAEPFEKARAFQQLAILGTAGAVPVVAAYLDHPQLAHYAREALEAMADPAADAALRTALGRVKDAHLVGVVNSLGARRDAASVPPLQKIAADHASPANGAAYLALARIGGRDADATVRAALRNGPAAQRARAAEAGLLIAQRLLAEGDRGDALTWFDEMRATELPGQVRWSALRGALLVRGAVDVSLLTESLRSGDAAARGVALTALREIPGEQVTVAVIREFARFNPAVQALTIGALVDRGDGGALPLIERETAAKDAEVRVAAFKALGRMGASSSVVILLRALGSSADPAEEEAAQRSLAQIEAPNATADIVAALGSSAAAQQVRLIAVLGERGDAEATPAVLKLAHAGDAAVRRAALRALALLSRPGDLPALIALAVSLQEEEARTLADRALYAASMKILEPSKRAEPLLAAFRAATDPATRAALVRPMGAVARAMGGDAAVRQLVAESVRDGNVLVRDAAVKCLADWPDATPAAVLLEFLLATPDAPQRGMAFDGLTRMAAEVGAGRDKTPLDPLAYLTKLNAAARTDGERMKVVAALGSVRRIEAFRLLVGHLDTPAVSTEAALAIVQIAPALLNGREAGSVRDMLQRIATSETDPDVRRQAALLARGELPPTKKGKGKKK